jgi:CDGSH-type Zn-finger protein
MAPRDAVVITAYRDGPLLVRGPIQLLDASGRRIEAGRDPIALCRCGKSRIRPFCDGTHKLIGFRTDPPAEGGRSEFT